MNSYEQRQQAKRERLEERAEKAREQHAQLYARAKDMAAVIPFGQPILVGHHSEHRDRNYRNRIHTTFGRSFEALERAQKLQERAETVGEGGIASDDPAALDKLREKLALLVSSQERMKAANKAIRKHAKSPEAQQAALVALGFTEEAAAAALRPDHVGRIGFPGYALSNGNANIQRVRDRIAQLERMSARGPVEEAREGYVYKEDQDAGRLMLTFPGVPPEAARDVLKRHGFKWSRYNRAWVRKLTPNAIASARWMREALEQAMNG